MKKTTALIALALFALTACSASEDSGTASSSSSASAVASAGAINWDAASDEAREQQITFTQIEEDVKNGAKFYDVRSTAEYEQSNFSITESFPLTDMKEGNLPDVPKDTRIYVHCQKGIRSAEATKLLREAGYTNVVDMGGLEHVQAVGGILS